MTPAARVQTAIELLDSILDGHPAEQALTNWARRSRFAGSGDRAAVRDHVFQVLRRRRSCAALGGGETGRALMIGVLRAQGIAPEEYFTGERYAPAALGADEARAGAPRAQDLRDLPDWLWQEFEASLGPDAAATAEALRHRAPVSLRVNSAQSSVAAVIAALRDDAIEARADPIAPTALIVTQGARRISAHPLYREGVIELQDGASQAAMARIAVPEGGRVLDFCAGGGGKSLALAARASARWFAHDALPARMRDLPARAARAGVEITQVATTELAALAPFDLVLCDVPCSGSGTWRRAPEAKWALTSDRLEALLREQAAILDQAAMLVAPGGALAYVTCSVLRQENEARIAAFLEGHPGWQCDEMRRWPVSDAGDGFFYASLGCKTA